MQSLAYTKEVDLREAFSCWLSREFTPPIQASAFDASCALSRSVEASHQNLWGTSSALTPILAEKPEIKTIALPVVAAGDQGYRVTEMLAPLLDAALHWLENGLPLDCVKIVAYTDDQAQDALRLFSQQKAEYVSAVQTAGTMGADYDVFISYSRANTYESEAMERALRESRPNIKIFVDRKEIDIGSAWQSEIFEGLDRCRKMVAMLSPDYLASKVCKEEFNIAWIRGRETDEEVIFPIYLYTTALPTYMKYRNYFDCREGDNSKIAEASTSLLAALAKT